MWTFKYQNIKYQSNACLYQMEKRQWFTGGRDRACFGCLIPRPLIPVVSRKNIVYPLSDINITLTACKPNCIL